MSLESARRHSAPPSGVRGSRNELIQRTGLTLTPEDAYVVLHHASCLEGDAAARRNDALYASIGNDVIQACAAVYTYLREPNISRGSLSTRVDAALDFIVSDLCRTFSLEELIVLGASERR